MTAEILEIEQLASLWTPGQSVTPIGNLLQQLVDKKEVRDSFCSARLCEIRKAECRLLV